MVRFSVILCSSIFLNASSKAPFMTAIPSVVLTSMRKSCGVCVASLVFGCALFSLGVAAVQGKSGGDDLLCLRV